MMRSFLLWLSRNKTVRGWLTSWGFARRAARRFVAGETIEEAVQAIRELSTLGITATLDHLGENVETAEDATAENATLGAVVVVQVLPKSSER